MKPAKPTQPKQQNQFPPCSKMSSNSFFCSGPLFIATVTSLSLQTAQKLSPVKAELHIKWKLSDWYWYSRCEGSSNLWVKFWGKWHGGKCRTCSLLMLLKNWHLPGNCILGEESKERLIMINLYREYGPNLTDCPSHAKYYTGNCRLLYSCCITIKVFFFKCHIKSRIVFIFSLSLWQNMISL